MIGKLILFVSDSCNLSCAYCYVMALAGGDARMSERAARDIARNVAERSGGIEFVQFFGGEPTLNMLALRAFTDEVRRLSDEGVLAHPPRYGIVTNGASGKTRDLIDFCREHRMSVTVSLDGPKEIHDELRKTKGGRGTFDDVVVTIGSLVAAGVPVIVETVYTSLHIERGHSISELSAFVQSLGARKWILHTVYPPAPAALSPFDDTHFPDLIRYHEEAVDSWFLNLTTSETPILDVYFNDLLTPILQGTGSTPDGGGCPGGRSDLSIGPTGDVYSCHLLYRDRRYWLGNVFTEGWNASRGSTLPFSPDDLPKCGDCFARYWCQPCGALNAQWGDAWIPAERECELRRAVIRRIGAHAFASLAVPETARTAVLRSAVGAGNHTG